MFETRNEAAKAFKPGDKIRIVRMDGEPRYNGRTGEITGVDDAGQLHGTWGGLAVQPERDLVEKMEN